MKPNTTDEKMQEFLKRLSAWLPVRLSNDKVVVK